MKFKFIEHTADIQFQAFGNSLEEVFKNSALAMSKSILDKNLKGTIKKSVEAKGRDNERLLYDFLEELLILFDSENFLITDVKKIKIKDNELKADVVGVSAEKYEMDNHIKSVTYNNMFVKKEKNKWITQVVLDV
jgi:SHS2 domain-containing protein